MTNAPGIAPEGACQILNSGLSHHARPPNVDTAMIPYPWHSSHLPFWLLFSAWLATTKLRVRMLIERPADDPGKAMRSLRALLKVLLRRFGWKCVELSPDEPESERDGNHEA